ncbi:hypothetical protein N8328_00885 [Crocinitomicaceae bacterium]|nr:hypothetical protein [Crocinitomicaceae bacterium]
MAKTKFYIFIFALIGLGIAACKKDDEPTTIPELHTNYFSVAEGRFVIYDAIEIFHDDDLGVHDTITYQLKTVIGQTYIDNTGREGREFERYKSNDQGATWVFSDTWAAFLSTTNAELVEENQRKVKLVFAPTSSKQWDINAHNSLPAQYAIYDHIHELTTLGANSFDSTVTVVQSDLISLVDFKKQREVYAKNVGMIQKYSKDLVIENFDTLNPKSGKEIFYNLVSFGFE